MNNSLLNNPHQRKLLKKWSPILESGKTIENETTKIALAQILENTRNYYKQCGLINENTTHSDTIGRYSGNGVMTGPYSQPYTGASDYGDYYLPNVVLPMLRRIMPDLIANELVGVQPLNGPVGYALAFRPTYGQNGGIELNDNDRLTSNNEIGYNPTNTKWTGSGYANSTLSSLNPELSTPSVSSISSIAETSATYWEAYGSEEWLGEGASVNGAEYATLGKNYPTVSFGLVKTAVEAKTRKLAAHWSPELAEDMQAMHGIDVEREMVNTLTYEVGAEIDRQIVTEMVKAAIIGKSVSDWTPVSADGLDQMGRLATLLTQITIEANNIALKTKRGNANFVVTTPRVCALLQQLSMNKFSSFKTSASMPTVPDTGVGALAKIGLINDDQQLLIRDSYVQAKNSDYILMGYKGKQAGDSGIIYCPYIPLQLMKVMQPGSFTPSIGCRTRYGVMSNPYDARNYYHFMRVYGMTNPYSWSQSTRQFVANSSFPTPSMDWNNGGDVVNPSYQ